MSDKINNSERASRPLDGADESDFGSVPSEPGTPSAVRYNLFERALFGAAFLMFVAMILATLGQIVFRYVLEVSVTWTEEVARSLFVLSMLMAIVFAYREREHIIVDFLYANMPPVMQRWLGIVFNLCILAFIAFAARGAWRLAELNWTSTLITVPAFSVAYFYIWQLAALALLFLYVILDTRDRLRRDDEAATALERDHNT